MMNDMAGTKKAAIAPKEKFSTKNWKKYMTAKMNIPREFNDFSEHPSYEAHIQETVTYKN
jgi:hypothetical protein